MAARSDSSDREIAATRVLNAPRALVWKVWTDPEHVAQWWGPNGFTSTIHKTLDRMKAYLATIS